MRRLSLALAAASTLFGVALTAPAQAAPAVDHSRAAVFDAVYRPGDRPLLEKAQYYYGGRQYCWYARGWRGPGYYWCGYGARRGYGWGGGVGWRGWGHGYHGRDRYRGGHSYHGGGRGGHHGGHGGSRGGGHSGGHSGGSHGGGHHH